ncbi:hypothetical protein [Aestuariivirga sp.]|uniref:hypothetical protein n=1 Tax=Aestuariivirga sp. TaxID=2650926 RepID=UPI0039E25A26
MTSINAIERAMKKALDGTFMRYNRNFDVFVLEDVPKSFMGDYFTGTGSAEDKHLECVSRDDPEGLARVARVVQAVTGITVDQMRGRTCDGTVSFARRLFCYMARRHAAASNLSIARYIDRYSDFVSNACTSMDARHAKSVPVLRAEELLTKVLA